MASPSMVHRSGDTLVVRSVVSGDALYQDDEQEESENFVSILDEEIEHGTEHPHVDAEEDELDLPQCKIKRNYTCTDCNFYSQNPRSYLYHLKDIHKQKIRVYECPSCLYASKHSQKLQRHVHMVHVMNKRGKQSVKKKKPKKAVLTPSVVDPRPVPGLSKLTDVVQAGELLKCSICGFATRNANVMGRHEKLVHLKKRFFRCNKCNYVTHMRARYTKHVKYHSMPMIKCDLCDFRTPYKWNLDRHYKNHTGDGAFKCALCNFTADIKQSLTVHEMNHHVPPVGQAGVGVSMGRRRNKVGASDSLAQEEEIGQEELELLRMEREDEDDGTPEYFQVSDFQPTTTTSTPNYTNNMKNRITNGTNKLSTVSLTRRTPKIKMTLTKLKPQTVQEQNERHNFQTDFIHPDDIIHHKNGNVYIKNIKCQLCNYKAAWEGEMARHENKVHGIQRVPASKKIPRPIPNLIPIQNKTSSSPPPQSALPILRIPSVRSRAGSSVIRLPLQDPPEEGLSEKDLNEICAKSCPNSSLRDFASLMGGTDAFSNNEDSPNTIASNIKTEPKSDEEDGKSQQGSPTSSVNLRVSPTCTTSFKRKNASFFDKLKEKLLVGTGDTCNLTCWCGYESKCLSELMRHQKVHSEGVGNMSGVSTSKGSSRLSSTRCQLCRQRCKTSSDLVMHLQSCQEARKVNESVEKEVEDTAKSPQEEVDNEKMDDEPLEPHPMENKVFVWNSLPEPQEADCEEECLQQMPTVVTVPEDDRSKSPTSEGSFIGVEMAPGYGAVMGSGQEPPISADDKQPVKKVFKCPHCTFWASTASRFHVHIVGHLNKKPFECSLCAYRSNWRWDITKHIRLKSARDRNHESAGVLMTDETGRRNYSKYNKYLTLMRVHEPTAESSGSGRRSKGTDITQGMSTRLAGGNQLQSILPAPPKLTRAPDLTASTSRHVGAMPLRPPPPLRAAHLVFSSSPQLHQQQSSRTLQMNAKSNHSNQSLKRSSVDGKKTLWKCKKCNYRDASRELVLAHVKEHYQQRDAAHAVSITVDSPTPSSAANPTLGEASVGRGHAPFRCGHCHQVSNWKHVIQRHCRLKHSGDVRVVRGGRSKSIIEKDLEDNSQQKPDEMKKCETCSFTSQSSDEMDAHYEQHMSWQHNDNHPESPGQPSTGTESGHGDMKQMSSNNFEGSPTKRYKCAGCPYVSNSKSQFLYHKQFHRPRGAPFKCGLCSYNVSRRHLLHQHLRVHGILIPPQKSPTKQIEEGVEEGADEIEEVSVATPELDTRRMSEIPLVWVSRENKFSKMFKCRFCPHVNMRKANIHEHEKMHAARGGDTAHTQVEIKTEPGTTPPPPPTPQLPQHHCPDCNYICNNAGVLSSHAKVHQGMYGQVHCLVDASKSDEVQIKELTAMDRDGSNSEENQLSYIVHEKNQNLDLQKKSTSLGDLQVENDRLHIENEENMTENEKDDRLLYFCPSCPARFLFGKELGIHIRFHDIRLPYHCESCSYTARQRPHLLAHLKVHSKEYQERTATMLGIFETSLQHPRPPTVIHEESGRPVWVVTGVETQTEAYSDGTRVEDQNATLKLPSKQHSCHLCPATFFKSVALQYHLTLHGGLGPHKCRFCDYAVKTYGNLVKHEMIHNNLALSKSTDSHVMGKGKMLLGAQAVPLSGTDLFEQRVEAQKKDGLVPRNNYQLSSYIYPPAPVHVDPQFGTLMHGNPNFVYPTYLKNGRLKEKRYKCHKCPSAFEKREQYKVHLSLHGAKQRYKCEKCDYSVKYYANYIQHMRKHQNNEQAMLARKIELGQEPDDNDHEKEEQLSSGVSYNENIQQVPHSVHSAKTIHRSASLNHNGPLQLSVSDRQSLMLLQHRRVSGTSSVPEGCEEIKKTFWCPHCPYSSIRRDGVESHVKRHEAVSGIRGMFVCNHCDYSVPQQHFLREHNKLHFVACKKQPEAYMKCNRTELWFLDHGKENITEGFNMEIEPSEKNIIFKDLGNTNSDSDRFHPILLPETNYMDNEDEEKIYVDVLTGEPVGEEIPVDVGLSENKAGGENTSFNEINLVDIKMLTDESEQSSMFSQSILLDAENKSDDNSESDTEMSKSMDDLDRTVTLNVDSPSGDLVDS